MTGLSAMILTQRQINIIEAPLDGSIFLSGPAGSGKTTAGVERLKYLAQQGIPGKDILLFFPQRNLGSPFAQAINSSTFSGNSLPTLATLGGLARRSIDLFWPAIVEGLSLFSSPSPPVFLTLESSIYFLSRIVEPLIREEGLFASVSIQRNRLFSQILDNLNKAAVHGFPFTEISHRLSSSWIGEPAQKSIFEDAGRSACLFREYCLANNLLDFSLQIEVFAKLASDLPLAAEYFRSQYKHLIYDNVEEDIPAAHAFINSLLQSLDSSLLIYDDDAGYRIFLGADPEGGLALADRCRVQIPFEDVLIASPQLKALNQSLQASLSRSQAAKDQAPRNITEAITIAYHPYTPQMVSWVADQIQQLLSSGTPAAEIVVLAPFLSDSLRFLLTSALDQKQIPSTSHRPSRALRDEPAVNCLLTLAALAHPDWNILPSVYELSLAFLQALGSLDLARSNLLSKAALSHSASNGQLAPFEDFPPEDQDRITFLAGTKYQHLLNWLSAYRQNQPLALDHFLIMIFGEILSQPGFGFHDDFSLAETSSRIIDSARKFRLSAGKVAQLTIPQLGAEYYRLVKSGVLGNQYLRSWTLHPENAVFLAPAHTFLLGNQAVDYQFWLDVGSRGWYERIYQPLTNPYVLHRNWHLGDPWRDIEELKLNRENLAKLTTGLLRRCKKGLFCCLTETDDRGFEQNGLLIQALNNTIRLASSAGSGAIHD